MSDANESAIFALLGPSLTYDDHDARMDALLWSGAGPQTERQLLYVSPAKRMTFAARLGLVNGKDPATAGIVLPSFFTSNSTGGTSAS